MASRVASEEGPLRLSGTVCSGRRLGDFEIQEEIGRGGMGVVYRARQVSLSREVALKVLPPSLGDSGSSARRFRNEAKAVARLRHPNIVPVYAQGECEGHLFYAMELVRGKSLDEAIHDCPNLLDDYRCVARMLAGASDGLAHAHEAGVFHRDIKPHNLLLGNDGVLRLTDFGLAYLTDQPHATACGEIMGTAAYLAPEQAFGRSDEVDQRTDIYAMGATLYELLTHHRPFDGESRDKILNDIRMSSPPPPRKVDPRIPRELETICLKAMAYDASHRYSSAAALAEDLRRFDTGRPILAKRAGWIKRGIKLVRRRPASITAMATVFVALCAITGWMRAGVVSRRAEADSLIQSAYDRLAYVDYRMPELVAGDIDRAQKMQADPYTLDVTQALAAMGRNENESAAAALRRIVSLHPDDRRARYMLSWALWRSGDREASREAFTSAEAIGGADRADAWFFRGLATHFDRPEVAADSYRQASIARAQEHQFYPQAVLHLARAYNQQMYSHRSADLFDDADFGLRQLIEHGHYGSYPYYLISIAHRLSAEILAEKDTAQDEDVDARLNEALQWALAGQGAFPEDERLVTAEAECLETMGMFETALEARTRAISLAQHRLKQWEGYHYRWRLNWWLGHLEEAMEDLEQCVEFDPSDHAYSLFYRGLLLAEMGDEEGALSLVWNNQSGQSRSAQDIFWEALTLRFLGHGAEAVALLRESAAAFESGQLADEPDVKAWNAALYAYDVDLVGLDQLLEAVNDPVAQKGRLGEAHFHAAARAVEAGDMDAAAQHLESAYRSFDGEQGYSYHGKALRRKLLAEEGLLFRSGKPSGIGLPSDP
ncbi:MAG: protein kinase [Phycisphaerae bacterium]|nr:protein kinase [Phycisphaerae bacterium]